MEARLAEQQARLGKRATFEAAARALADELRGAAAAATLTDGERAVRARVSRVCVARA